MKASRKIILFALLGLIGALLAHFTAKKHQSPVAQTVSPLLQVIGKPIQSLDRSVSKLFPISEVDEKMLGEEIKAEISDHFNIVTEGLETDYLNTLVKKLTANTKSSFDYQVFVVSGAPNAMALPGGVICVSFELLWALNNEAELVAILGHEIGHIERGHLFDAARKELLRRKLKQVSILEYASDTIRLLGQHCLSKTQEDEADEYAFRMLLDLGYDPFALSRSFKRLMHTKSYIRHSHPDILTDFCSTHPYMEIRMAKFEALAESWQAKNPNVQSFVGEREYQEVIDLQEVGYVE